MYDILLLSLFNQFTTFHCILYVHTCDLYFNYSFFFPCFEQYKCIAKKKTTMCVLNKISFYFQTQFCIALRYFATGSNYMDIADVHGVSRSTVCRAVKSVSDFFHRNLSRYVKWPDKTTDKANIAYKWYRKTRKPKVFGLVDGTHIPIACPRGFTRDENQYFCYKGYYSINAMVSTKNIYTM